MFERRLRSHILLISRDRLLNPPSAILLSFPAMPRQADPARSKHERRGIESSASEGARTRTAKRSVPVRRKKPPATPTMEASESIGAQQSTHRRKRQYPQVQPQRPVLDVIQVMLHPLLDLLQ